MNFLKRIIADLRPYKLPPELPRTPLGEACHIDQLESVISNCQTEDTGEQARIAEAASRRR